MSFLYVIVLVIVMVVLVTTVFSVAILWGRRKLQIKQRLTYEVTDNNGVEILDSISIGGKDNWVHIRGRNKKNPILLFIHGGPGFGHIGWFDEIQRPWEDFFTVVQWDQIQAGKSYVSAEDVGETINHKSMIEDTEEMIRILRMRFKQEKIFIMGTSYGTYLGMQMVKRHPDWLHAYVGVGQVVNMMEHARVEYELLLNLAKSEKEISLVKKLEELAPFPGVENPAKKYGENCFFFMEEESRFGKAYPKGVGAVISIASLCKFISPLYSLSDLKNHIFGDGHAVSNPKYAFYSDFMKYDLPSEIGSDFETPVIFFTGRNDFHVSSAMSDQWFGEINAPYKQQVWFEKSAHIAFIEEPYEFSKALVEVVLPLANE